MSAQEKPTSDDVPNGHDPDGATEKPRKQKSNASKKSDQPAGGFDNTPIPHAPPGYTVKITFHKATNLPLADINSLSSDPFILAQLNMDLRSRHKEDPYLRFRTKTIRQNTDPVWDQEWIVANVPASGFKLKARVYDEDPADHDDRLGNVHVDTGRIDENWAGIKNVAFPLKKRMASKRAYLLRAIAVCFRKARHMSGDVYISVQVLGRSDDEEGGRAYTVGPCYWTKHYSPLLGRLTGQKDPRKEGETGTNGKPSPNRYNFQANQMQLHGPVPAALYHRYVEFKPFVKSMFTSTGIRGFFLSKALHHQHARVYNFDRSTEYGAFQGPCKEMTLKFLELVHQDQGGRIFTYVLTLDSIFRFTETGKEFGIDMLSKHTMHSDVSIYIAFSGEFFIRRLKNPRRAPPDQGGQNKSHPPDEITGGPPKDEPKQDPSYYELVIDNDSGTYRPNAKLLPQLRAFFEHNFPGLHVTTLDSQADSEKMNAMKQEQRDRKKKEGDNIIYRQVSRSSSLSSSDIEDLDRLEASGGDEDPHFRHTVMEEVGRKGDAAKAGLKAYKPDNNREGWRGSKHQPGQDDASVQQLREENGEDSANAAPSGTAQRSLER